MSHSSNPRSGPPAEAAAVVPFPGRIPERLVGFGFRCWHAGFVSGDISTWEEAWNVYRNAVGDDAAKPLVLRLSQFVRAVRATANREIGIYPMKCRGFCRDECLVISIIAASQHDERNALCTCAAALAGSYDIGDTIARAQDFAFELKAANQVLSASSICTANCPIFRPRELLQ